MADKDPWEAGAAEADPWERPPQEPSPEKPAPRKKKDDPSFTEETTRVFNDINEHGIASALGAPVDWMNKALGALGLPVSEKPLGGSESIRSGMRSMGMSRKDMPPPETLTGKVAAGLGKGAVESVAMGGALGGLVGGAGRLAGSSALQAAGAEIAAPGINLAAGAGGGVGGELAKTPFEGKPGEGIAELAGNLVGGGIGGLAHGIAAPKPRNPNAVLDAYERLGLAPSAAEADVGGRVAQWLEGNVLPQTIGGGGVMERFKQRRLREITDLQSDIAQAYGSPSTRHESGQAIQESVMDTWNNARDHAGQVIGNIAGKYAQDVVYPQNFINAIANPVGAASSRAVRDQTLDPMVASAAQMVRETNGNFTMADLAQIRQLMGRNLEPGFQKNVNDAQVDQLYKALVRDIQEHVRTQDPNDYRALQQANAQYASAMKDFKANFRKLVGSKDIPVSSEKAFDIVTGAATEKGRGDLREFRAVWDALPPQERGNLASTILMRLGSADKNDLGNPEKFSLAKFVGGYRDLSEEARDLLFNSTGNGQQARALDDLVTVADNIQNKIAKLASSSRSGVGHIQGGQIAGAAYLKGFTGLMTSIGGPYLAAQVLTNPTAVRVLTRTLQATDEALEGSLRAGAALQAIPKMPPQNDNGVSKLSDDELKQKLGIGQ